MYTNFHEEIPSNTFLSNFPIKIRYEYIGRCIAKIPELLDLSIYFLKSVFCRNSLTARASVSVVEINFVADIIRHLYVNFQWPNVARSQSNCDKTCCKTQNTRVHIEKIALKTIFSGCKAIKCPRNRLKVDTVQYDIVAIATSESIYKFSLVMTSQGPGLLKWL